MIEYIFPHNPDDRVLKKASELLKTGKLVCIPTDTNWIVVCDPNSKDGVERLYKLKGAELDKHFSLLCDSISRASDLALINDHAFKILKRYIPGHYTFIFECTKKMAKTLKASKMDKEIGIRFVPSELVSKLIQVCDHPLLSTNLTEDQMGVPPPYYSVIIEDALMGAVDMIIDPGEVEFSGPSTIISFTSGSAELLREGVGTWP